MNGVFGDIESAILEAGGPAIQGTAIVLSASSFEAVLITSFDSREQPNYQVQYSCGDDIYLNSFGQTLVNIVVSGFVQTPCAGQAGATGSPGSIFDAHNIGRRGASKVTLTYSGRTYRGYISLMSMSNAGFGPGFESINQVKFEFLATVI